MIYISAFGRKFSGDFHYTACCLFFIKSNNIAQQKHNIPDIEMKYFFLYFAAVN